MEEEFSPPPHLSDRAKAIWASVVPERAKSVGRLTMLQAALEALDRADAARLAIESTGLTTTTKTTGAVHLNPLAKLERESRQQFCRIWTEMGLSWQQSVDGVFKP